MTSRLLSLLPLLVLTACGGGDDVSPGAGSGAAPAGSSTPALAPPESEAPNEAETAPWTARATDVDHEVTGSALLTEVRVARNDGFDRVVLEFEGEELPSYHIEYIDRPVRQCGSGDVVEIAGDGWLSIRVEPANAHTEAGEPTVMERTRRPELTVLRELTLVCDFEAQVEWVLGVASPNPYRVMELADPARLVVDVRH